MSELDPDQLADRLARARVTAVGPLAGGASSLTFEGVSGGQRVVVKVAPLRLPPILHRNLLCQARVVRSLAPTSVPVPEVLWEDPGEPPEVPPLFMMSFLEGTSLEPLFDLDRDDGEQLVASRCATPPARWPRRTPWTPPRSGSVTSRWSHRGRRSSGGAGCSTPST